MGNLKRKKEKEEHGEDVSDISEDEDFDRDEETLQVEFQLKTFEPTHYHIIKTLVTTLLDDTVFNYCEFIDLILDQKDVGSALQVGEEIFGVVAFVNLSLNKAKSSVQEVIKHMMKKVHSDSKMVGLLSSALNSSSDCALLVNERAVNLPAELSSMLHFSLLDDVKWINEHYPKDPYNFTTILYLTKAFRIVNEDSNKDEEKPVVKRRKVIKEDVASISEVDIAYYKPEDSFYAKYSQHISVFPLVHPTTCTEVTSTMDTSVNNFRVLMIIERSKWPQIVEEIQAAFGSQFSAE
eukprot:GCRY01001700.1.p1 GENE.GCRY01001700.1~~GCRY01001700.1.p1  ORF type:complete len:294 (-),score=47.27 GCRY01001700.1:398-1279(-)